MASNRSAKKKLSDIPKSEWVVGAVGALIVAAAMAFLLRESFAGDHSPPDIRVEVKAVSAVRDGFRVQFEARNEGGEAAASVPIEGAILKNDEPIETSEVTIDYLPARSERGGGLFFTADPRTGELRVRARGYEDP